MCMAVRSVEYWKSLSDSTGGEPLPTDYKDCRTSAVGKPIQVTGDGGTTQG